MSSATIRAFRAPRWFRSRRSPHAFVLTKERLAYVGPAEGVAAPGSLLEGGAAGTHTSVRLLSRPLPADTFTSGLAGAPIAGAALAATLTRLLVEAGGKIPAASLVVPDDFVKVVTVELEDPERRPREVEEILLWKFGKAFGDPAPPLRLSWQTAGATPNGTRILALAVSEEAAASWEGPFEKAGIRIGALETASLAVSSLALPAISGDGFLLWADGDASTTLFYAGGALTFARTRATTDPAEALQEIRLAASFVGGGGDAPALDVSGACAAGPDGSPVVEAFRAFREEHGGTPPARMSLAALAPGARVVPAASAASDPALLVALGAMAGGA